MLKQGDLILTVWCHMIMIHKSRDKFHSKWEGPFVIESICSNRAYRLDKVDSEVLMAPINSKFLKSITLRKFPWR